MLKLLVDVVPEIVVNETDQELLLNRSVGGYVFSNSVSLINIIFRFYKDSSIPLIKEFVNIIEKFSFTVDGNS